MEKIVVLGAGGWGTALALLLAEKGFQVWLWARRSETAARLASERENYAYLPGVKIPAAICISADLPAALAGAQVVVCSVPSQALREVLRLARPHLGQPAAVVNTAKGLEIDTGRRLSEVMAAELPPALEARIAVLSGPSHAEEVARRQPTAIVAAAADPDGVRYIQDIFMGPRFRVYTNPDLVGVELGGALKNIIALATGIAEGLGLGDNSKAALLTRGLAEITRLGKSMGANPLTFAGLTGLGDLVVTCNSRHSRNRRAGIALGQGKKLAQVLAEINMAVEGVPTTRAAFAMAAGRGVEMPITREVYEVLFNDGDPRAGVDRLMGRDRRHEVDDFGSIFGPG